MTAVRPYFLDGPRRALRWLFVGALVLLAAAWWLKGTPVDHAEIDPSLRRPPMQRPTDRAPFSFEYKGRECRVRPVAEYELRGLVMSHNDIESMADIYHDSTSVDTKDLCVLWGSSLGSNDFHRLKVRSGPFTCYYSYPRGLAFDPAELANNHLITDDPGIRERIEEVNVGDQILLRGLLVDYQMEDWRTFWRETSTRRDDAGCEVVFVEDLEILERGTPGWYRAYRVAWAALLGLPGLYVVVLWLEAGRRR